MTNEELAVSIKAGNREHLETLWNQCYLFIRMRAFAWKRMRPEMLPEAEDLIQCGYFALVKAVDYYDPDPEKNYSFLTALNFFIPDEFKKEIGIRNSKRDPIINALRLDAPSTSDEESSPLIDTISDPSAEEAFETFDEDAQQEHIRTVLEEVAQDVLTAKQREVLHSILREDTTCADTASAADVSRQAISIRKEQVFWRFRNDPRIKELYELITAQELRATDSRYVQGTGFITFAHTGASVVERIALKNFDNEARIRARLRKLLDGKKKPRRAWD